MIRNKRLYLFSFVTILLLAVNFSHSLAQSQSPYVQIVIQPTRDSWNYEVNEKADLTVSVLQNGIPLKNISMLLSTL